MPSRMPGFFKRHGTVKTDDIDDGAVTTAKLAGGVPAVKNIVDNGDMQVWQRGTTINAAANQFKNSDGKVCADRWILISENNDEFDVTRQDHDTGATSAFFMRLTAQQANQKGGIWQMIEGAETRRIVNRGTVTLSFRLKVSNVADDIDAIRYGVLQYTGTEDADNMSQDIVSAWNAEDTEPSWSADWSTLTTTPTTLVPTNSWVTYSQTITVDSTANNLAVFIIIDEKTYTTASALDIDEVQLEFGSEASAFVQMSFAEQMVRCGRHFWKTFDYETAPTTNAGSTSGPLYFTSNAGSDAVISGSHGPMWEEQTAGGAHSVQQYNPTAASNDADNITSGTDFTFANTASQANTFSMSTAAATASEMYRIHITVESKY